MILVYLYITEGLGSKKHEISFFTNNTTLFLTVEIKYNFQ